MTRRSGPVLVFVTDPSRGLARTCEVIEAAARTLGPGLFCAQLRDKGDPERRAAWAPVLRTATRRHDALLVVNGDVDLAIAIGADGAHIPSHDVSMTRERLGGEALVTTPAHVDDDVRRARDAGASAVLVSPIFATPGEGKAAPRGITAIENARVISVGSQLAILALGGIDAHCVEACAAAGADGVAAIRALYEADDPAKIARLLADPWARRL